MSIRTRVVLCICLVVAPVFYFLFDWIAEDLTPEYRESTEEPLVDISHILAAIAGATTVDGKIDKEDLWGSKDLAYPIKKQTKGYVAHFEITADPKNAKTIDKTLKVEEDILRYLLVRV